MTETVFLLLVLYQLKHYLADFPLQGAWMLGKFRPGWDFVGPLAAHAGVHGLFTLAIAAVFGAGWFAVGLAVFDFVTHFVVDRIKASPDLLGRYKPDQRQFWWALGGDQMAHHLCHYFIIWMLVV